MKRLLIAGALAFAAAGQALAADLPQPAAAAAAHRPPTFRPWRRSTIGAASISASTAATASATASGAIRTTVAAPIRPAISASTGFLVGRTVGANFQTDAFVFGIEGDFDASWLDGKGSSAILRRRLASAPRRNAKPRIPGSARCARRVGYAADRVLFYGTAGGAFGNIEAGARNGGFVSSTKAGWTAGAGVEVAFTDNWTARVEYLFVDLENATCTTAILAD